MKNWQKNIFENHNFLKGFFEFFWGRAGPGLFGLGQNWPGQGPLEQ
jgi:hypothetical protein